MHSYNGDAGPELDHLDALQLPPGWTWIGPWEPVIEPVTASGGGTGADGWSYAFNFGSSWEPAGGAAHFVRRRTWRRRRAHPQAPTAPVAQATGLFRSLADTLRGK